MSKSQAKKLPLKLAPYLFIVLTIFTVFESNNGIWV